jgi:hypothetical protein
MRRSVTWLVRILSCCDWCLTCENGGFEQLNELVDLDERVDSHLQISAVHVSMYGMELGSAKPTILGGDDTPARRLEQAGIVRK